MSKKPNPAKPSQKPTTEIAFILDRSGSMQGHVAAAIGGFNDFLADQQQVEGLARLTLVLFDDVLETPFDNIPICEVVPLDTRTYTTRNTTALLDAIGLTIESFERRIQALPKTSRPSQVIFAIFTDGLENASSRYTWKDLAAKIKERQEKDGWQFLFLGANQDAIATAAQMNIHAHNAATASYSDKGVQGSARAFSRKTKALRESLMPDGPSQLNQDIHRSMDQILREEEERE
jgi:uncharacterized protein YegL